MKKCPLTVTLNPALDRFVLLKDARFLKDAAALRPVSSICALGRWSRREACLRIQGVPEERISAGGKGVNVARSLRSLGVRTRATGFLGGETGDILKVLLKEEGLPADFVATSGRTRVNVTLTAAVSGRTERRMEPGGAVRAREQTLFLKTYEQLLPKSSLVILSGRNANGASDTFYARLIRLAKKQNVPTVLDTSGRPLAEGIKAGPFLIKPNIDEFREVWGAELKTLSQIKRAVQALHDLGIKIVLVSLGRKGAVGSNGEDIGLVRPPQVTTGHDVGCGDAFLAGFLYSFLKGAPFRISLRWAAAAGAANALSPTPGAIRRTTVRSLLRDVEWKRV